MTKDIKKGEKSFTKEGKMQRCNRIKPQHIQIKEAYFIQIVLQTLLHFITNV